MKRTDIAMVCKLMPYYRLGIFQELTSLDENFIFYFFGDTVEQGGIKQIPYSYASAPKGKNIRWVKTRNFFYRPESLLWQTGIIKEIFKPKVKAFVFEGGLRHLPIWLYALLCKLRGKKVLYWTHGNRGLDRGIVKFSRKIFFKWLGDGLLLYGHNQRNIMIDDGYDPDRLFVIYNSLQPEKQFEILEGLDYDAVQMQKQGIFKNPRNFTLFFIGRLVAHKEVMEILKAVKRLKDDNVPTNCIFIGDGPERKEMDSYCSENGLLDQVHFAGALYKESIVAPFFAMSDLMVSPGNVGLNCIHALAYGVPVITHSDFRYQNPEVEAITEGVTGTFFEYGNMNDMTLKIKLWIKNKQPTKTVQTNCQNVIRDLYNPAHQSRCIISGLNQVMNDK